MTKYFLQIIVQSKASDDWRSFLYFLDVSDGLDGFDTAPRYCIRGYGSEPTSAVQDVWEKYNDETHTDTYANYEPYDSETSNN